VVKAFPTRQYDIATAKLAELRKDFAAWEAVARTADFPSNERRMGRRYRVRRLRIDNNSRRRSELAFG
jgi:hypothetical protein